VTAATDSAERRWDIPIYVWPPVLGVSVALHLSMIFGLAGSEWRQAEVADRPETEIVIESGGIVFEDVSAAATEPLEPAVDGNAQIVEPAAPEIAPSDIAEASDLQPLSSETVPSAIAPAEVSAPVVAPAAQDPAEIGAVAVDLVAQPPIPAAEIAPVPAAEASLPQGDPVAVVVPESQAADQVQAVDALPAVQNPVETLIEAEPVPVAETQNLGDGVSLPTVAQDLTVAEQQVAPVVVPIVASDQDLTVVTEVAPTAPVAAAPASRVEAAQLSPQIVNAQEAPPTAVSPATSPVAVPDTSTEVETVSPALQEIEAVAPTETVVAALSPSEPDTEAVPTVAPPGEPAENVPPVEVATIDPLAKVTSYVEDYDFGDCAHLSVLDAGADSAKVTAFGAGIAPFALFDQRFTADQGFEASIELRLVTRQQCSLLNALGLSEGIEAAGLVELDSSVVRSGASVAGVIERDLPLTRIASAQQAGLDLGGKGPPELYLIDDAGQIHDGREFLLPASNARTAGAWRFKVPVTLISGQSEETAVILAIWNRPAARQPSRFGVLPPDRIAGILEEPGVFSLSAFKVSR
jgi:hypothetical protein